MIRSTSDGTWVWFELNVQPGHKIEWPLELFLAFSKTAKTEAEMRCKLWDSGEISAMTEREMQEIDATRWKFKNTNTTERLLARVPEIAGSNNDNRGGLKTPEKTKEKGAGQ